MNFNLIEIHAKHKIKNDLHVIAMQTKVVSIIELQALIMVIWVVQLNLRSIRSLG